MPAEWALEVMRKAPYITVSFIRKDGSAYGLPLSLASAEDGRVWYFHCALEGEKLEAIEAHPQVCLSAVSKCSPTVGPKDGSFTLQYRSAVAFGRAEQVFDEGDKDRSLVFLSLQADRYKNGGGWRMLAMLKKMLDDNGIDVAKKMKEWRNSKR